MQPTQPKGGQEISPLVLASTILSMNKGHAKALNSILGKERKVKLVERLFRASEYDFRTDAFHYYCDGLEDTLVLIRTEFGKTIGGYTHYPWDSSSGWLADSGRRAFLLSLDMNEKFVPQWDDSLIYRSSGYGPTFGWNDISVPGGYNSERNL